MLLMRSTDQVIEHRTPVAVHWTECHDGLPGGWNIEEPTRITIPKSCELVRIRAGVSFETNPHGLRQMWTPKNGQHTEPFPGYITPTVQAVGDDSSTSMMASTPRVSVEPGDYFELFVYQNCGDPLRLRGAFATWLELEILE